MAMTMTTLDFIRSHAQLAYRVQAVLEVYALHDIDIRPHVLLALVLYKVVDQVRAGCIQLRCTWLLLVMAQDSLMALG